MKAQALAGVHARGSGYAPPRSAGPASAAVVRVAVEQGVLHGTRVALMFAFVVVGFGSLISLLIPSSRAALDVGRHGADGFEPARTARPGSRATSLTPCS